MKLGESVTDVGIRCFWVFGFGMVMVRNERERQDGDGEFVCYDV